MSDINLFNSTHKGFDLLDSKQLSGSIVNFVNIAERSRYTFGYIGVTHGTTPPDYGFLQDFGKQSNRFLLGPAHVFDPRIDGKAQAINFVQQLVRLIPKWEIDGWFKMCIIDYFRLRPAVVLRDLAPQRRPVGNGRGPVRLPPITESLPSSADVIARIEKFLQVVEDALGGVLDQPILMISPHYAANFDLFSSKSIANHPIWLADSVRPDGKPDVPDHWQIQMYQRQRSIPIGATNVGLDYALELGRVASLPSKAASPTAFSYAAGLAVGSGVWYLADKYHPFKGGATSSYARYSALARRP